MSPRTYIHGAAAAIVLTFIMTAGIHQKPPVQQPEPVVAAVAATATPVQETAPKVFGSIPYWDQPRAISVIREHIDVFDYVSVFWYLLEDGKIAKYDYASEDAAFVQFAQANGVKVLALIANLPEEGDWDSGAVEAVIGTPEARTAHIAEIAALVKNKGFDGVNIDYEMLEDSQTENFSTFIRELTAAMHAEGKIVAVAVHAQEPDGETRGQDLVALQAADIISLMSYDDHWDTSDPGPSAGLPWVRGVLEHMRGLGVDMRKVFMGIPLYGYDWPESGSGWGTATGREYQEIQTLIEEVGGDVIFDTESQTLRLDYEEDGVAHEMWFEDVRSFAPKYDLAKEFDVGGVMFWRQGQEDERIYDILK